MLQYALRFKKFTILSIKAYTTRYNLQPNKEFDPRIKGKTLLERRHVVVVVDTILWLHFSTFGNNDPAVPSNKKSAANKILLHHIWVWRHKQKSFEIKFVQKKLMNHFKIIIYSYIKNSSRQCLKTTCCEMLSCWNS